MSLSNRLQRAWYRTDGKDLLSIALLDIAWMYGRLVKLRKKMYAAGVLHTTQLPVPVVVVGNVVAGGVGKTPVVIELVRHLQALGKNVGVVSRGYGRSSKAVSEVLAGMPASATGDEPLLLKRTLNVPVFVGADRVDAAQNLLDKYPDTQLIVSDDGLQHLRLGRDLEIIVFDERGVGNGRMQPAGPLREAWPRLTQCPQLVLYRGKALAAASAFALTRRLADHAIQANGTQMPLSSFTEPTAALAGIGNPEAFFTMLREAGVHLGETLALPDHSTFDSKLFNKYRGNRLICTEKDAVKLFSVPEAQEIQILAVPLITELPPEFYTALNAALSSVDYPPTEAPPWTPNS